MRACTSVRHTLDMQISVPHTLVEVPEAEEGGC